MAVLVWDAVGERFYETGTKKGVLWVYDSAQKKYGKGVAWNGLTAVTESPSGADANDQYADDIKYLSLRGREEFGGTIEAFTAPDEFGVCDGSANLGKGVTIRQQTRKPFAFSYVTILGNDTEFEDHGYKIHIVYGATASPSERSYSTVNDSPDITTLSWEFTTTPVEVTGFKPTAHVEIDSTTTDAAVLKKIEDSLWGSADKESELMMPNEILALLASSSTGD